MAALADAMPAMTPRTSMADNSAIDRPLSAVLDTAHNGQKAYLHALAEIYRIYAISLQPSRASAQGTTADLRTQKMSEFICIYIL